MSIVIATDTVCNVTLEQAKKNNIHMIPLSVIFDGTEVYKDMYELTTEEFYEKMRQSDELPTSSQPTVGEFQEFYSKLAEEYDDVISIHVGSQFSGTVKNATIVASEINGANIHVVDTGLASVPQGYLVMEAVRMVKKSASVDEILERLEEMSNEARLYVVLGTLENLIKGGRLSTVAGTVGTLFRIKPILLLEKNKLDAYEKIRTKKKALKRLEEILEEEVTHSPYPVRVDIAHGNNIDEAREWQAKLREKYPDQRLEIFDISPVVGVHAGAGVIAFAISRDYEKEGK